MRPQQQHAEDVHAQTSNEVPLTLMKPVRSATTQQDADTSKMAGRIRYTFAGIAYGDTSGLRRRV